MLARRAFIGGLISAFAAPAIVRFDSLMPVVPVKLFRANSLLTINEITREAVRMFRESNSFIKAADFQYDDQFAKDGSAIEAKLCIFLPLDYRALAA